MDTEKRIQFLEERIAALEREAQERQEQLVLYETVTNLQTRIAGLEKQCSRQIVNGKLIVGDSTISAIIHHMDSIDFQLDKEITRLDQRINYFHP